MASFRNDAWDWFCAVGLIFLGHQGRVALTTLGSYLMLSASQKMGLTLRVRLLEHLDGWCCYLRLFASSHGLTATLTWDV